MTITTIRPGAAEAYSADDIRRQLVNGRTVQQVADRTGWPRPRIVAVINGTKGWLLDPTRDTACQPALTDPEEPMKAADPPPPDPGIELKQPAALLALIARTLGMLSGFDDQTVAKQVVRASSALIQLEEALTIGERRRQAEADIEAAKAVLAAAQEKLRLLKTGKALAAVTSASPEVTPKEIRAWAAEHGIECAPTGKIPASVRQQYDNAHAPTD